MSRVERAVDELTNVSFDVQDGKLYVAGHVKEYAFIIDSKRNIAYHDCKDWQFHSVNTHEPCKHMIAVSLLTGIDLLPFEFTVQFPGYRREEMPLPDLPDNTQDRIAHALEDARKTRIMETLMQHDKMSTFKLRRHLHLGKRTINLLLTIMQNERMITINKRTVMLK
jgi:hypothetical protein